MYSTYGLTYRQLCTAQVEKEFIPIYYGGWEGTHPVTNIMGRKVPVSVSLPCCHPRRVRIGLVANSQTSPQLVIYHGMKMETNVLK